MMMRRRLRCTEGFTLTEVLVALLVLALALVALQVRSARYLEDAVYLRERSVAGWVAHNQLTLLRLSAQMGAPLPSAAQSGSVQMAGQTWYWHLEPLPQLAPQPGSSILPLRINVSPRDAQAAREEPLLSLEGVSDAAFSL